MYYIIINPASKSGRGIEIWKKLEPIMTEKGAKHHVIYSERPGHIYDIVEKLCDKLKENPELILNILVLGGDGTINEAIQGITDFSRVRLGYIPTGSSNDLARDLGYPEDPAEILNTILEGQVKRTMDMGIVTYHTAIDLEGKEVLSSSASVSGIQSNVITHRFLTSCGIGFDAGVCEEILHTTTKKVWNTLGLGKVTYLSVALKQIAGAKSIPVDMTLDNNKPIHLNRFLFIAAMNHRYEGGGFKFCPDAVDNDGILDLCVIGDMPKAKMLMAIPTAFKGEHFKFKNIDSYKASRIRLKTESPLWVHTDGEVYYQSDDIEITIEREVIQFLA